MAEEKPSKCPSCASERVARIVYGYPAFSEELRRGLELGESVLGGCCVEGESPLWRCLECGREWGTLRLRW